MAKQVTKQSSPRLSSEQRARRRNQIILAVFSIMIIAIWVITLVIR